MSTCGGGSRSWPGSTTPPSTSRANLGPLELAAAGVTLGEDYPEPIVDHRAARDRAIDAYQAARGS